MLTVAQLVEITVNLRQTHIFVKMVLQVFCRCRFARGVRQTGLDQFAEDFIFYTVESDIVKYPVKYQVRSVNGDVGYTGQKLLRIYQFPLIFRPFLAKQVKSWMSAMLFALYPFAALTYQLIYFII